MYIVTSDLLTGHHLHKTCLDIHVDIKRTTNHEQTYKVHEIMLFREKCLCAMQLKKVTIYLSHNT